VKDRYTLAVTHLCGLFDINGSTHCRFFKSAVGPTEQIPDAFQTWAIKSVKKQRGRYSQQKTKKIKTELPVHIIMPADSNAAFSQLPAQTFKADLSSSTSSSTPGFLFLVCFFITLLR